MQDNIIDGINTYGALETEQVHPALFEGHNSDIELRKVGNEQKPM